jgi:hypothetical protein
MSDKIGLDWLERVFELNIWPTTIRAYWLLILDGYSSYLIS